MTRRRVNDLALAAYLQSLHPLLDLTLNAEGRGNCWFEDTPELHASMMAYQNDHAIVAPRLFFDRVRALRNQIKDLREDTHAPVTLRPSQTAI